MEGDFFFLSKQGFRLFLLQIFLKNRFVRFGRILARRSETDIYVMRSFSNGEIFLKMRKGLNVIRLISQIFF